MPHAVLVHANVVNATVPFKQISNDIRFEIKRAGKRWILENDRVKLQSLGCANLRDCWAKVQATAS